MSKMVVGMKIKPAITPHRIDCGFRNTTPKARAASFNQSSRRTAGGEGGSRKTSSTLITSPPIPMSLVDVRALRHIWNFSRAEFAVAMVALLGVLGSGPVNGVLMGAGISIVLLLRQAAHPRVTELGRIPGTTHFADRVRHEEAQQVPGVLVIRCESSIVYFNAEHVRERFVELLNARSDAIQLAVFSLAAVPKLDLAGAELLADLHKTLRGRGIDLKLAHTHDSIQ